MYFHQELYFCHKPSLSSYSDWRSGSKFWGKYVTQIKGYVLQLSYSILHVKIKRMNTIYLYKRLPQYGKIAIYPTSGRNCTLFDFPRIKNLWKSTLLDRYQTFWEQAQILLKFTKNLQSLKVTIRSSTCWKAQCTLNWKV